MLAAHTLTHNREEVGEEEDEVEEEAWVAQMTVIYTILPSASQIFPFSPPFKAIGKEGE